MYLKSFLLLGLLLAVAGCKHSENTHTAQVRFHIEADDLSSPVWSVPVELPKSKLIYTVSTQPFLWEGDITHVDVAQVELGVGLLFTLSEHGAQELYRMSIAAPGKRIFVFINNQVIGVRLIDSPIESGQLFAFIEMPDEDLPALADTLNSALSHA